VLLEFIYFILFFIYLFLVGRGGDPNNKSASNLLVSIVSGWLFCCITVKD
jgi:hypothetical protein